ncbi:MAG TPA: CheR family methyltransferase [Gaiellaceae bacterium]|nr:CheR family methyltransferase [Gaiellaceae bacterium]
MTAALAAAAGLDLSSYRPEHVDERVRRALERERIADRAALARLLRSDPAARSRFRGSVAVSVSGLFRDPAQFELLERELLPPLLSRPGRVTVWSAGCADGSELYSVAMLLDRLGALERVRLLGSDVLEENLERARGGVYGETAVPDRLRARARWEQRDLVRQGAPAGRWRLVLCRNVAIYLAPEAKRLLHATLAGALAPGGVLLLGRSERLTDPAALGLARTGPHAYRKAAAT